MGYRKEPADKPVELIIYEQMRELNIPIVEGGLMDQPHIWMVQYATCKNKKELWQRIIDNATKPPRPS